MLCRNCDPLGQPKGKHAPRLRFPVLVPEKYEEEIIHLVMGEQVGVNAKGKPIIEYQPYTVEIQRKNGEYYIHLIYEEEVYGRELDVMNQFKRNESQGWISILTASP
jgi:hypothetical protein